jgi:hypothetical protein
VALTVTFTVCDAQQIGLSPSETAFFNGPSPVLARSVRPEQKATPVLAAFRPLNDAAASRRPPVESTRAFPPGLSEIGPTDLAHFFASLSCQLTAGETTRGPPRMDPPSFC